MANKPKVSPENIRKAIVKQLKLRGKDDVVSEDIARTYVRLFEEKEKMLKDIEERGSLLSWVDNSGNERRSLNPAVDGVKKITSTMQQIRRELELDDPIAEDEEEL